jgi:Spx/MgsR family transcriptional regulator
VLTIYGISNCDTCRKARKWLDANTLSYRFHDIRIDGLDRATLERWAINTGWKKLLNVRSTTWRGIPESTRQEINERRALELMLQYPTLIKRPVLEFEKKIIVGFSAKDYAEEFGR